MVGKVLEFDTLDAGVQQLIRRAVEVRERAYSPYSRFQVGAALMCAGEGAEIYTGCNVETGAHGSICAERSAIVTAVSCGRRKFAKIAVVGALPDQFVAPCGPCRQFIAEFGYTTEVYLAPPEMDKVLVTSIQELLPLAFRLQDE